MTDVSTTPRKALSPTARLKLFEAHGGKCGICGQPIRSGERWIVEHMRPLSLGGTNEPDNLRPVHVACALKEQAKRIEELEAQETEICRAFPTTRFMDPPDGGNVSIAEQIKRLWEETEARGRRIAELEAALKDARETALEEAAIEIERIGHSNYPAKLITDGHAFAVRSLKAGTALEKSDDN